MFDVRTYWPRIASATLVNTFDSGIVQTYAPAGSNGDMMLSQTQNGIWAFDWYYKFDRNRGVLEYRDDYPKSWYNYLEVWRAKKQVWMPPGKEIIWGGMQSVGDVLGAQCVITGLFGQYGWQEIAFYGILPMYDTPAGRFTNVLLMEYWQEWNGGAPSGARIWLAESIGMIREEWTFNKVPTGYSMMIQKTNHE